MRNAADIEAMVEEVSRLEIILAQRDERLQYLREQLQEKSMAGVIRNLTGEELDAYDQSVRVIVKL